MRTNIYMLSSSARRLPFYKSHNNAKLTMLSNARIEAILNLLKNENIQQIKVHASSDNTIELCLDGYTRNGKHFLLYIPIKCCLDKAMDCSGDFEDGVEHDERCKIIRSVFNVLFDEYRGDDKMIYETEALAYQGA